jgi:hypothetical protein
MKKTTYLATIINGNCVVVDTDAGLPDFIHMVKYVHAFNTEIYFSAEVDWTPAQEDMVMHHAGQLLQPVCG